MAIAAIKAAGEVHVPEQLPEWQTEADVDFYTGEFQRTGFRGGLNWYRNSHRNWELTAAWAGAQVRVTALYVVGDRDVVYHFPGGRPQVIAALPRFVPNLKQSLIGRSPPPTRLHQCQRGRGNIPTDPL